MAQPIISFIPENDKQFKAFLRKIEKQIDDFTIPFSLITNHWIKGNRKIFSLRGPGLYDDIKDSTKAQKAPNPYPILFRTGRLASSLVQRGHPNMELVIGKKALIMGTSVSYAIFHQSDKPRSKLPQRKVIFIDGGPAERAKDAIVSGRLEAWIKIIELHVDQVIKGTV